MNKKHQLSQRIQTRCHQDLMLYLDRRANGTEMIMLEDANGNVRIDYEPRRVKIEGTRLVMGITSIELAGQYPEIVQALLDEWKQATPVM